MIAFVSQGRKHGTIWFGMVLIQVAVTAGLHASGYYDGRPAAETLTPLFERIGNGFSFVLITMCIILMYDVAQEIDQASLVQVLVALSLKQPQSCTQAQQFQKHMLAPPPQLSPTFILALSLCLSLYYIFFSSPPSSPS